jgi:hypothetical protein
MNFPGKASGVEIVKSAKTHPDGAEAPVRYYWEEHDLGPLIKTIDAFGRKSPPDERSIHRFEGFRELIS